MIAIDKIARFLAGSAIAGLAVAYGAPPIWGYFAAAIAAAAKEIYDLGGRGTPDAADAIATILGGALVLPLMLMEA